MTLFVHPNQFFANTNGSPYAGAKLNFYEVGTSTRKDTYTDTALSVAHANPVVADSAGKFAPIYLNGYYKVVFTDSAGNVIYTDNEYSGGGGEQQVNDIATLRGLNPASGRNIYLKYHTTAGDGGHGYFRAITGAAPGTYTDDNGITIVPTGGDGSSCWRRVLTSNAINPCMFGAQGDWNGTTGTDDTAAIQACFNYVGGLKYSISGVNNTILPNAYVEFTPKASFYKFTSKIEVHPGITIRGNGAHLQLVSATVIDEAFATKILSRADYYDLPANHVSDLYIDCKFKANVGWHMIRQVHSKFTRGLISNCMQNCMKMTTCQFNGFDTWRFDNAPVPLLLQNNQWEVTAGYYVTAYPSLENTFTNCCMNVEAFGGHNTDWTVNPASYSILASIHLDKAGDNRFIGCSFGNVKNWGGVASNNPTVLTYIRAGVLSYPATSGASTSNKFIGCKDESAYMSFLAIDPTASILALKHQIEITNHTFIAGVGGTVENQTLAAVVSQRADVKVVNPFIYHLTAAAAYIADSHGLTSPFKYFYSSGFVSVIEPTTNGVIAYNGGTWVENYEHGEVISSQSTRIGSPRAYLLCREINAIRSYGIAYETAYNAAALTPIGSYKLFFESQYKPRLKDNTATPASATDGNLIMVGLEGSATIDPASIATGAGLTLPTTITVTGAALGDFAIVSAPYDLQGLLCTAYVSAANTVTIRLDNNTGGAIDLASGTWRARVFKQ